MRNIKDILLSRKDLSPFLVHLTRKSETHSAKRNLERILKSNTIRRGPSETSRYSSFQYVKTFPHIDNRVKKLLRAVSFSETPLEEIHCLLDIKNRNIELSEFGLVLCRNKLITENRISPVMYVNTYNNSHKDAYLEFINELYTVATTKNIKKIMRFMIFFESFGQKLRTSNNADFYWEREWRSIDDVVFDTNDIFLGLCPKKEIEYFENKYKDIKFIDPKMSPRYFSAKISRRKKELEMSETIF